MNCKYCNWARRSESRDNVVACGLWSALSHGYSVTATKWDNEKYMDLILGNKIENKNEILRFDDIWHSGVKDVYQGWANLSKRPNDITKDGILTNYCIIVKEDDICDYYEEIK